MNCPRMIPNFHPYTDRPCGRFCIDRIQGRAISAGRCFNVILHFSSRLLFLSRRFSDDGGSGRAYPAISGFGVARGTNVPPFITIAPSGAIKPLDSMMDWAAFPLIIPLYGIIYFAFRWRSAGKQYRTEPGQQMCLERMVEHEEGRTDEAGLGC